MRMNKRDQVAKYQELIVIVICILFMIIIPLASAQEIQVDENIPEEIQELASAQEIQVDENIPEEIQELASTQEIQVDENIPEEIQESLEDTFEVLEDESDLKSAFKTNLLKNDYSWQRGGINGTTGANDDNATYRARTIGIITISNEITLVMTNANYKFAVLTYNSSGDFLADGSWVYDTAIPAGSYVRIIIAKKTEDYQYVTFDFNEAITTLSIKSNSATAIESLQFDDSVFRKNASYIMDGVYINSSGVISEETTTQSAVAVIPIKHGHKYLVWIKNGNRWRVLRGNDFKPTIGNEYPIVADNGSTFTGAVVYDNTYNNGYLYIYYYNGSSIPEYISKVVDLTEIDAGNINTYNGLYFAQDLVKGPSCDTVLTVFPLAKNTDYKLTVDGGNRRNFALSNDAVPTIGNGVYTLATGSGTDKAFYDFNSGDYTYLYAYCYTSDAPQNYPVRLNLEPVGNELVSVYKYAEFSSSSTAVNTGVKFVVGEYNLAKYNNDTQTYISVEKLHNVKKAIADLNADVVFAVEDAGYIDGAKTKSSHDYVFRPIYPFATGSANEKLYSKVPFITTENANSPSNRPATFATISVNNKTVLLILVHTKPGIEESDVTARLAEFNWLITKAGTITHDYCIMTGDFNPEAGDSDLTNMETVFLGNNMIMCNDGYFDYMNTWFDPSGKYNNVIARQMPLDYVITSGNVVCNNFTVYANKFNALYSDHVPVVANLTLLDT